MDVADILTLLAHGNQLKRTARTGWVQRGVPNAENVAAHSYGVAYTALVLAQLIPEAGQVDTGRLLTMAVVHDLPESLTSDIPAPVARFMPAGTKRRAEQQAMSEIVAGVPAAQSLLAAWAALEDGSLEAQLVHDADKLDMYFQAHMYEEQTGSRQLSEFWAVYHQFHFAEAQTIYDALRKKRVNQS